jgi:predicted ABC-type transport system involved in lysophospholipase L1 biosynthesis ATPase subunit
VTADHIFDVFEHLIERGKTIIMVTHDNSLSPRFSRHLFITDGEITTDQIHHHHPEGLPLRVSQ